MFANRIQAANLLADRLQEWQGPNVLVLALPRGAVPMAKVIADRLCADLDVELVHKFGFPDNPEFALGSVSEEGDIYLGAGAERYGLSEDDVRASTALETQKLKEKRDLYTPFRRARDPKGRLVIVVDDGMATGATMTAAVRTIQKKGADRIIVATPVASSEAVKRLLREGVEVVALSIPSNFYSVSQFYDDFSEVSDDDVIRALNESRSNSSTRNDIYF